MATPSRSDSSPDTDREFDPSADILVNEYDDEHTLDEEETMSGNSCASELDDLQKESDMPLEELLAMYGYQQQAPSAAVSVDAQHESSRSSSEEEILSNRDLTLDKDEIARDVLKDDDDDNETSVDELLDSVDVPSQTARLLRSNSQGSSDDDDDDEEDVDYKPVADESWKKTIQVGRDYQAQVPEGLCKYDGAPAYENEDRQLWNPSHVVSDKVEQYLREVQRQDLKGAQGVASVPQGAHTRDDEQALYLLLQCGHSIDEAIRRRKMQAVPPTDPMSLWSEEECQNFENGLRHYGKDFFLIQQNKVRTRSVGELVQFYYLWKKTERHDVFANKNRLEKKKYALHPGITDYMDRFLDDQENPAQISPRDRSMSPVNNLLYGDHKRQHHLQHPHNSHSEFGADKDSASLAVSASLSSSVSLESSNPHLTNNIPHASGHSTVFKSARLLETDDSTDAVVGASKKIKLDSGPSVVTSDCMPTTGHVSLSIGSSERSISHPKVHSLESDSQRPRPEALAQ